MLPAVVSLSRASLRPTSSGLGYAMDDDGGLKQRFFADVWDEKVDSDDDVQVGVHYAEDDEEKEDDGVNSSTCLDDGGSAVSSSPYYEDLAYDRGHADVGSEDGFDVGIKLSEKDEQRILGAFLLAADGGLDEGDSGGARKGDEEVQLPSDGPTCLKKFTTIAASLGLKTTREQLREDFEGVVRSNGLVESTPSRPWEGACDTKKPVTGFTYKVFRRYYLAKIQGKLLEVNIRQAWEDLYYGTGKKRMPSGVLAASGAAGAGAPAGHQRDADHGSGRPYVTRAELQKILTREGEALTDEEVDELLRECRPDAEGRIVYEGYRRMLIDPSL